MNEQYKFRNLWVAILSLFLLNIGTLGWVFLKNQNSDLPMGIIIKETLKFDKKQEDAFEPLKNRHFEEAKPIRDDIRKDKDALFAWVKSEKADSVEFERLLVNLSSKIIANERITFKHFRDIRNLCSPEQKKIFDEALIEKLKNNREKNRSNPPPRPPHES